MAETVKSSTPDYATYLQEMEAKFQQAMTLIQQMGKNTQTLIADEAQINADFEVDEQCQEGTPPDVAEIAALEAQIAAIASPDQLASIQAAEAQISSDWDSVGGLIIMGGAIPTSVTQAIADQDGLITQYANQDLESQLEQLDPALKDTDFNLLNLAAKQTVNQQLNLQAGNISQDQYNQNTKVIQQVFSGAFNFLLDKIQSDKYAALVQHGNDPDAGQDLAGMEQCAAQAITTLTGLQDALMTAYVNYDTTYNNAEADDDSVHWYDEIADFSNIDRCRTDRAIMANCQNMMDFIQAAVQQLSPSLSGMDEGLAGPQEEIHLILLQVEKIMKDTSLTTAQKRAAVLDLMIQVLGLLETILSIVTEKKAANEQLMEKATKANVELKINDTVLQAKEYANAVAYSKAMGIVMKVAEAVMTVVFTVMAPGAGSAFAVALMGVLEQTGAMDSATNALASKMGTVGADILMTGLCAAAGMGLDGVAKVAMKSAMNATKTAIEASVKETIEAAAKAAVKAAGKEGDKVAEEMATNVLKEAADSAVNNAAKETYEKLTSRDIFSLVKEIAKKGTLQIANDSMKDAALAAAKTAVEDAEQPAIRAARVGLKGVEHAAMKEAAEIGAKAGSETAAKMAAKSDEPVKIEAKTTFGKFRAAAADVLSNKAVAFGLFGVGSTNLIENLLTSDDKNNEALMDFIKVLNGLIIALSMAGAGGAFSGTSSYDPSLTSLYKTMTYAQYLATAADAAGQAGSADALTEQANSTYKSDTDQANISAYQMIMDRLMKSGQIEAKTLLAEIQQEVQALNTLRLYSGEATGARIAANQVA